MSAVPRPLPVPQNGYQSSGEPEPSSFLVLMNIVNTCTHLLLGAVACSAFVFANAINGLTNITTSFEQHIYLCVSGYIILMSQAVLTMSPFSGWSSTFKYQEKKTIHWVMQILGSTLAIAGTAIRMGNVTSDHFSTAHGSLGIVAFIFNVISLIGGILNLYSQNLRINPNFIKICHAGFGSLTLICAFLALVFGFDKIIYRAYSSDSNANMLISFTIFALIGILMPACVNVTRRLNK